MKKRVHLTESKFKRLVLETAKKMIREAYEEPYPRYTREEWEEIAKENEKRIKSKPKRKLLTKQELNVLDGCKFEKEYCDYVNRNGGYAPTMDAYTTYKPYPNDNDIESNMCIYEKEYGIYAWEPWEYADGAIFIKITPNMSLADADVALCYEIEKWGYEVI